MPKRLRDVADVVEALKHIYTRHCAGCCLHIFADDGNIEQEHIDFCRDYASERGHDDCLRIARRLSSMTERERMAIYTCYDQYAKGQAPPAPKWTDRSPEERQRILHTPITFTIVGGQGHGGTRFTELGGSVRGRRVCSPSYDTDESNWSGSTDNTSTTLEGDE